MITPMHTGCRARAASRFGLLILGALLLWLWALAPAAQAEEQYWYYTVRPGDTIWDLTRKHCTSVRYWKRIQKLNDVDLDREIPPGTRLRFPLSILKHQPAAATVAKLFGTAQLFRAAATTPEPVRINAQLRSGDRVLTGADSNLTLRFADGSQLLVLSHSEVVMDALSAWGTTGMVDTRIRLKAGRVDTHVEPAQGPGSRYQIITPAAVAAVRGTAFRVSADSTGEVMRSEVAKGAVAVRTDTPGTGVDVNAGFGLVAEAGKPPPPPRELLPPPDLSALQRRQRQLPLQFRWQALPGAQGYRVQVAPDTQFETLLLDKTVDQPAVAWADLKDGHYALRVRGIDGVGLEGLDAIAAFEVDARPLPPPPSEPANGSVSENPEPDFRWTATQPQERFRFQLAHDPAFSELVADTTLTGAHFSPERPLAPGVYHWRVAALDGDNSQGPFGATQSFTYRQALGAPDAPALRVDNDRLRAHWQPVAGADRYQLQIATDPAFEDIVVDRHTPDTEVAVARPASEVYYYRVRALRDGNEAGPYSESGDLFVPPLYRWWPMVLALPLLFLL